MKALNGGDADRKLCCLICVVVQAAREGERLDDVVFAHIDVDFQDSLEMFGGVSTFLEETIVVVPTHKVIALFTVTSDFSSETSEIACSL